MSDVTIASPSAAPPSAEPAAPAAPASEVVINQSPVDVPSPLGSQTPKFNRDDPSESVRKAFERASQPPPKPTRPAPRPEPKPAEAKMGHNQPPEETEKIDLRKRPGQDIPRGERGQFAPRSQVPGQVEKDAAITTSAGEQKPYKQLPKHAPFAEPPPRISERARYDWADTPETVRGEFHRQHQEFGAAYQQYRADHEAMNVLRPYHQLAQQHGTTVDKALNNFITMEIKLRENPLAGLDLIVHNLNLVDPQTNKRLDLRDISYMVLSQTPEQLNQIQQGNVQNAAAQQINALNQRAERLENHIQQMQYERQFFQNRMQVDQVAASHPRLDELVDTIREELDHGYDLETATARAELLRPATHAAQTRTTPAQTRPTDRSIHGNPDASMNGAPRRPREASKTPEEAMQNAFNRFHGRA